VAIFIFASTAVLARPAGAMGLVGHWPFEDGAGTTATDVSDNGNSGTLLNGPEWIVGKFGYGLLFDGVDDYVEIAHSDSLNLTNELTVSAWIYNQGATKTRLRDHEYHIIASKGWAPDPGGSWTLAWDKKTNDLLFCMRNNSDKDYKCVFFNYGTLTNDWHHVAAVFNNGTISLYIDGSIAAEPVNLGATSIKSNTEDVRIGAVLQSPNKFLQNWHGYIDEVRIYSQALTELEIKTLYEEIGSQVTADSSTNSTESSSLTSSAGTSGSADFALTNSGPVAIPPGSSATATISANSTTAKRFSISFSVSGLPQGVSASFSPRSCNLNCSTLLTIQASTSTPVGTYPITVKGSSGSKAATTSFTLSVTTRSETSTVATPTISPNGATFTDSINVSLADSTLGAAIYYTTDGTDPTETSILYTAPFSLTKTALVKAKAFKSGATPSSVASAWFNQEAAFDFSLGSSGDRSVLAGSSASNSISTTLLSGSTQPVTLSASGLPSGATASFSSTTCSPSCSSTLTINTTGSTPAGNFTITVSGSGGGLTRTTSFNLAVSLPTVATPTITPNGGSFTSSVSVTMQTATAGATIYYTTDGSTPTQSSTSYSREFTLTSSATVKAKAFMSGYNPSAEASASFTIGSSPRLTVTWQDNSTNEDNFQVERKMGTNGTYGQIVAAPANTTSFLDTSVTSGATYCYRVRAANSSGTSAYSNEACAIAP
jgi:hypothetical protein